MSHENLRAEIQRELCTVRTQCTFERARVGHDVLQRYVTMTSLLDVLDSRSAETKTDRQLLLRALILAAQRHLDESLWKLILLYTFQPGLYKIRQGTSSSVHLADDLDAELWAVFLEVVQAYPLHRTGSIPAGILFDTRKRYHQRLRRQRRKADALEELAQDTSILSEEERLWLRFKRPAPMEITAKDRGQMLAALVKCDTISVEDARLLWLTDICGMTVPQFVESQQSCNDNRAAQQREKDDHAGGDRGRLRGNGNRPAQQRELERVWRWRLRARQRVQIFYKKSAAVVSSFGGDPADYLVRGKISPETTTVNDQENQVQCALRKLAAKLNQLITIHNLNDEVAWSIALSLDEVIDEHLSQPETTGGAHAGSPSPHPAMVEILARLDSYGQAKAANQQSLRASGPVAAAHR